MAHPDDGYLIPDDDYYTYNDEDFCADDEWGPYRTRLFRMRRDEEQGIVRIDRERQIENLERLKKNL